jgi:hypothetical protein
MSKIATLTSDSWGEYHWVEVADWDGDLESYLEEANTGQLQGVYTEECLDGEGPQTVYHPGVVDGTPHVLRMYWPEDHRQPAMWTYELFWEEA